jgi:hypothetical protein
MPELTRAEELYDQHRDKVWDDIKSGTESFDKNMLTFSSGALALSLAFIKDVVPLSKAIWIRLFKQRVMDIETRCRITGVTNSIHLRASHCKPWRDSTNEERLNGENGLLLTPTIDHLFDRGFISFEDSGALIVSPVAHAPSLNRMGVATDRIVNVGAFTEGQKQFLDYHRESVLLQARH